MRVPANIAIPKLPWSRRQIFGEIIALAGLLFLVWFFIFYWRTLPERIPTHFGFSGRPNGWGSKNQELPIIFVAAALYGFITLIGRFPRLFKFPVAITEENIARQLNLIRSLLIWIKVEAVWGIALLQWCTFRAIAKGVWPAEETLPEIGGFAAALIITAFVSLRLIRRAG
jgi:uncharacterized membrane protein